MVQFEILHHSPNIEKLHFCEASYIPLLLAAGTDFRESISRHKISVLSQRGRMAINSVGGEIGRKNRIVQCGGLHIYSQQYAIIVSAFR